jgi:hypothetical protein
MASIQPRAGLAPTRSRLTFVSSATSRIAIRAACRCYALIELIKFLPGASTAPTPIPGYPLLEGPSPSYLNFEAAPSNDTTVIADSNYFSDKDARFTAWRSRAQKIRAVETPAYCTGNLSVALDAVGAAYQASSNASTTLLTLLPTAGALIGAPAKELWVLSKLVPIAGLLSMALSLGGNIVPHQVGDYASLEDFSYSCMRNNNHIDALLKGRVSGRTWNENEGSEPDIQQIAEHFAEQVHARAMDLDVAANRLKVGLGILMLCIWILLICVAC